MSKEIVMDNETYGALVGLLEGVREEHFKGKDRLNIFEKAFQRLLDQVEIATLGACDVESDPPQFLTCDQSDIQDFIASALERDGKVRVVVNGANWEVTE